MVALTSRAKQANICSILATKFNPGNFSQSTSFQLFEWSSFQRGSRIISDCSSSWPRDSVNTFIRLSSVRTATRPAVHSLWKCLKSSNFKGLYSGLCSAELWFKFSWKIWIAQRGIYDSKATTALIHWRIFQIPRDFCQIYCKCKSSYLNGWW